MAGSRRTPRPPSPRAPRALLVSGRAVGLVLLAAFGLVLGAIVYLNTPAARRLVAQFVNDALAPSFQGRIQIERLGGLGLGGVSGADVTIYDPYGRRVLVVRGARVRIATLSTALSAVFGKRVPLTVQLPEVSVDRLEANLDSDSIGRLYLVNAFAPTRPSSPPDPNARGLRLVVSRITLKHGWVHGHMAGAPPLDVDLDGFQGALVFAPDVLEGEVSRVTIAARRILNGADVGGSLNARVRKPSDPKAVPSGHIDWQGSAAGASHQVRASLQDEKIHAVVDFPRIDPENVRLLWADSSVDVPASVHVEGHGTLSSVDVALHARLGKAAFDATGNLSSGDEKRATLSLSATEVDVHELVSSAPQSSLGLTGNVVAAMNRDGDATGEVKLDFGGGRVGNIGVPAASIVASGSRSAPNRVRADAEVVVEEPTLPTRLVTKVRPKGDSSTVDFELASRVPDFGRVPQFGGALHGNASLSARGSLDVATTTIDAELRASAADLVQGRTRLQAASVVAHANGVVNSPAIDVAANVRGVEVAGVHLSAASVHATGAATAPHIEASAQGPDVPAVDASADVGLTGGVALRNLRVALARAGEHAVIAARSIGLAGGDVRVNEVRLDGVGAPMTADVALGGGRLGVRASTDGIDLGRVARIAHIEDRLNSGTLAFDLDMSLGQGRGSGQAILNVTDVATGNVSGLSAQLQGTVVGRRIAGTVSAQAAGVGSIRLDIRKLELGGSDAVSAASWRRAWGYVGIEGRADLARVAALWPTGKFPLAEAQGEVAIDGHVARDDVRDLTPDVTLNLNTNRLDVAPKTFATTDIDGVLVVAQPPWRLAGIDFDVTATVNGDSGLLQLSAAARDAKGALGQVDATAPRVPFGDFFHDTGRASSELQKMPVDIRLSVPERGLGSLPPILRQSYVTGKVGADVHVTGTMRVPKVDANLTLRRSHVAASSFDAPLDMDLEGHYDGRRGKVSLKANAAGRELAVVDAQAQVAVDQFLAKSGPPQWNASARAHFGGFPLDSLAFLDDKQMAGNLSGDLSLDGLNEDARATAMLDIEGLRVGSVGYKSAHVQARADGRGLDAQVHVDQPDGFLDLKARAAATWGTALLPTLDSSQPLEATLGAKNFRIASLLPFVDGTLDELDGRIDAATHIELDPRVKAAKLDGTLALTRGTIEASAGGGEFHDIAANVRFTPDGVILLEKLTASGVTGHLEATGSARLRGTILESAKAVVMIPDSSPIPLSGSGTEIGAIDGRIEITQTATGDRSMNIKVEVPHVRVALPQGSMGSAQALGPIPKVRVGVHNTQKIFVLLPLGLAKSEWTSGSASMQPGSQTGIEIHLDDVEVVRGTELKIDLTGRLNVKPGQNAPVMGQIQLSRGGLLSVQGKNFTVEDGTVTFVGSDPSNPEVVVKAGWAAPDGTTVYANFVGPLKTGKVALSSEPTLPQQEIVQLLLFGSTSGKQAQEPSASTGTTAIGTVGGEATQPLNHALQQLGLGTVTANVDTTESATPKPEVEVRIARDISLQLAVVLGQPPPGVNPDRTLLTLDWRFRSNWSLVSTLGNAGTTIFDLLWQRRY